MLYKGTAEREIKARTKICGVNGFKPGLFVTDAMFSLFAQVTCCIRWPLKGRLKPGPKSVVSLGFKPDLFVTDAVFSLFAQVTCCIREPLKEK